MTGTIIATSLRRIDKGGALGAVTLRVPRWRATLLGCLWVQGSRGERILLPRREWIDAHGAQHTAEIIVFDDLEQLERFEEEALAAVRRLVRTSRKGAA
jgi:hypothetical protein